MTQKQQKMSTEPKTPAHLANEKDAHHFRTGLLFAILGTALFSLKSIFIKLAFIEGIDATTLLTLRMLIALPFYLIILFYAISTRPHRVEQMRGSDFPLLLLLGFLGYYLASYLDFEGLTYISAQLERLTLFTYPVMVSILSWLILKEQLTRRVIASLLISYIGVSLLFYSETPALQSAASGPDNTLKGTLLVAGAAFSFSLYVIFSKACIARLGSLIFTSFAMLSASGFIVAQFLLTHELNDLQVSPRLWVLAFLLGIVSTLIPSFLTSEAIHRIGAARTSIMGTVGPVVTIILAVTLLDEPFGLAQIAGLVLVLGGVSLLRRR